MRTYTRLELFALAADGDSVCLKCGATNYGSSDETPALCEECGAQAVVPAENLAQVARLIEED